MKLFLPLKEIVHLFLAQRLDLKVLRKVSMLSFKHYYCNRLKSMLATWKPGVGRIYIVLSNYIFARNSNTILVSIGDFIRLLFSIKAMSKCLRIYPIGFYAGFPAVIKVRIPGGSRNLYSLIAIRV